MNKQEYIDKRTELQNQITALQLKLKSLKEDYIEKNKPFKIGQKVKVGGELGVVSSFELSYSTTVVPIMNKLKKDGKPSQVRLRNYTNSNIEPYE